MDHAVSAEITSWSVDEDIHWKGQLTDTRFRYDADWMEDPVKDRPPRLELRFSRQADGDVETLVCLLFSAHEELDEFLDSLARTAHRDWSHVPWTDTDPIYVAHRDPVWAREKQLAELTRASRACLDALERIGADWMSPDAWRRYVELRAVETHVYEWIRDFRGNPSSQAGYPEGMRPYVWPDDVATDEDEDELMSVEALELPPDEADSEREFLRRFGAHLGRPTRGDE